jgi:hypothetical protein
MERFVTLLDTLKYSGSVISVYGKLNMLYVKTFSLKLIMHHAICS